MPNRWANIKHKSTFSSCFLRSAFTDTHFLVSMWLVDLPFRRGIAEKASEVKWNCSSYKCNLIHTLSSTFWNLSRKNCIKIYSYGLSVLITTRPSSVGRQKWTNSLNNFSFHNTPLSCWREVFIYNVCTSIRISIKCQSSGER